MREVHLTITCDRCSEIITDEKDAELVTLTASTGSYELDVCSQCWEGMLEEMRPAPPKKRKAPSEQTTCPHCDRKFGSQRGLTKHVQSAHSRSHPLASR